MVKLIFCYSWLYFSWARCGNMTQSQIYLAFGLCMGNVVLNLFFIYTYPAKRSFFGERNLITKWEHPGSLSFTMVQRYLRVTISYCRSPSPFFAGCQQSNDSSSYSPYYEDSPSFLDYYRNKGSIPIQEI